MSDTAVRAAVLQDAERVAEFHVRAWRAAYRGILSDALLDGLSVERRAVTWRETHLTSAATGKRQWLLEREGRLLGYCHTGPAREEDLAPSTFELYALYVEPSEIGAGHGRKLLRFALGDLAARGIRDVTLRVLADNRRARRFYEKTGFTLDEHAPPKTLSGETAAEVRYRLVLPAHESP